MGNTCLTRHSATDSLSFLKRGCRTCHLVKWSIAWNMYVWPLFAGLDLMSIKSSWTLSKNWSERIGFSLGVDWVFFVNWHGHFEINTSTIVLGRHYSFTFRSVNYHGIRFGVLKTVVFFQVLLEKLFMLFLISFGFTQVLGLLNCWHCGFSWGRCRLTHFGRWRWLIWLILVKIWFKLIFSAEKDKNLFVIFL